VHRRALLSLIVLLLLPGCARLKRHLFGAKRDQITLERTTFATSDSILVTYSNPLEAAPGEEYWLTLVPAREPDSAWGDWHYVAPGAETDSLTASTSGDYEVRLHSGYPRVPYHVVARVAVQVK
jgi:hypothetical protein